ncbi:glutaredoxin 3 [Kangiella sp. HZ709]|uniref:glutaredoxin 3 n=1 Tax=Kangiella sp. HZ709 TaxID=2666328 RepID=UPI0012B01EAA|nr:glutaredoxin 3 [Kangiella sp. HZ709]MRX28235.1 glutaredoxin 3 [Kangiella sp. HZ709]
MKQQAKIVIYTKTYCPYCIRAKQLLNSLELDYQEISVDGKPQLQDEMAKMAGKRTVPQVFIDDTPIGGCDDLFALRRANKLEALVFTNA